MGVLTIHVGSGEAWSTMSNSFPNFTWETYPLIFGKIGYSHYVLKKVRQYSSEVTTGRATYRFEADITIDLGGLSLQNEKEIAFNNMRFSLEDLFFYIGQKNVVLNMNHEQRECGIQYKELKSDNFMLGNDFTYFFNHSYDYTLEYGNYNFKAEARTDIEITSKKDKYVSVEKWLELIERSFSMLFTFLIGRYMCPINVKTKVLTDSKPHFIRIYYRYFKKKKDYKRNKRMRLGSIIPKLPTYLSLFYDFEKRYPQATDIYFSLYRHDDILEYKFLTAVYSIETFSRDTLEDHFYIDENDFKSKCYEPLKQVIFHELNINNRSLQENLLDRVRYANQRSFITLLKDIIEKHRDLLSEIAEICPDKDSPNIRDMRNWLTHYDPKTKKKADKLDLIELYDKVRIIFEVALYKQINMEDDHIISIVKAIY